MVLAKEDWRDKHEKADVWCSPHWSGNVTSRTVPGSMVCYTLNIPTQSIKAESSLETALPSRILYTSYLRRATAGGETGWLGREEKALSACRIRGAQHAQTRLIPSVHPR